MLLSEPVIILMEWADFAHLSSIELAEILPKRKDINEHNIDLVDGKELPFKTICSLGLVELETQKIYIKSNLANDFIGFSKYFTGAPILFVQKSTGSLHFSVND